MTYLEAEGYFDFYNKSESEKIQSLLKIFAFYNMESSRIAYHGKKEDVKNYVRHLQSFAQEEHDIDDQFKGAGFEQQN